jgi:tagaturonate reductase
MMLKKLDRTSSNSAAAPPTRILQFGEGNFLRAFVDWMVDILNEKTNFNAGVQIIQPISKGLGQMLNDQDGLYHVVLKGLREGREVTETRLITCISKCINPYEDFPAFLKTAENPQLRFIISNTTEAGISFNALDTPYEILAEAFPGKVTQLLWHRYKFFQGEKQSGFIFVPCELIEKNGEALRLAILQYAELWQLPKDFAEWVNNANTFCNTLVDRIVPGFPRDNIDEIRGQIGYEDQLVVQAEPFHLWVVEAPDFAQQEFPLTSAGLDVKFVNDITPYRTRKVRILNGAHTSLVPVAYLSGLRTVMDAVNDETTGRFIQKVIFEEIIPTLDLPTDELVQFANDVIERFQNPFIRHELLSISLNSISKFKVRVLPSILEFHKRKGSLPENLIFSLAALLRFYKGEWKGEPIPLNDSPDVLEFFKDAWDSYEDGEFVKRVLANESFWGVDLSKVEGLVSHVQHDLSRLNLKAILQ